jgi:hypothetical protein
MTISWPLDNEDSKACLHFTNSYGVDVKCSNYCKEHGKTGGSCQKKRCVCNNDKSKDDNSKENENHYGAIKRIMY